jgi:hypothetical protein
MSTVAHTGERPDCDEQGEPKSGTPYRQDVGAMATAEPATAEQGLGAGARASAAERATPKNTAHTSIEGRPSTWWLRLGLAFAFGYASIATLLAPEEFSAYVPSFLPAWATHVALRCFAAYEVGLAVAFLSGRHIHAASLLAAATLIAILAFNLDAFDVLFRNVAIASAALALASATGADYATSAESTVKGRRRPRPCLFPTECHRVMGFAGEDIRTGIDRGPRAAQSRAAAS